MDIDYICTLCDEEEQWKDIPVTYRVASGKEKSIHIPLILTCTNGIYVFLESKTDIPDIYRVLRQKFGIRDGLYCFVNADDEQSGAIYDPDHYNFIEIEDFREGLENFFYNHLIPQSELHFYDFRSLEDYLKSQEPDDDIHDVETADDDADKYIRPFVSEANMEHIVEVLMSMEVDGYMDGNYMIMPDGSMQVKKTVTSGGVLGLGAAFGNTSEHLFPCEDEDGDKSYLQALFGGWFGLHKFKRGKWGQGILYLLTCGVGGIFYIYDLIMMLTGNYYDTKVEYNQVFGATWGNRVERKKQRIYTRPVNSKKKFAPTLLVALLLTMLLSTYVYQPIGRVITDTVTSIGQDYIEKNAGEYVDIEGIVEDIENIPGIEGILESESTNP